ncbi:DUF1778 domain-containing protein [Thiothrix unzii]|uniref:DUF1778 domain-containing protein n=1 Tax=Thiothrix unzii TaxID=111769 RepID=A0A975F7H7_9GAMM|nr:DUF1778 domain-containing protein [Thiothrix unzii]QTR52840.1 DUF1778 domain-containing protein [Thiothrix unzii]
MPSLAVPRDERIDLRLSADIKALLTRAAAYSGVSVSSFLVASAAEQAKRLVAEQESLMLTTNDWNAFVNALDETDKPRPRLVAAMQRYHARRGD